MKGSNRIEAGGSPSNKCSITLLPAYFYLIALESGNWEDLPNEVVARGFLRNYALFLGLDPDDLLAQTGGSQPVSDETASAAMTTAATTTATPSSAYKPINLDLYDDTPVRSNTLRRVLGFLLACILLPALFRFPVAPEVFKVDFDVVGLLFSFKVFLIDVQLV